MHPLETYLTELRDIRSTGAGVKETSYYPALSNLFNELGKTLSPRVRIINLANRGAGMPDGGLFTADQFKKRADVEPLQGQPPARGVIEVKGTGDDAWVVADGKQVSKYWGKYRQVLVTNYRDFVLVGQDAEGHSAKLETYRLAENEKAFWQAAAHPHKTAAAHGERFLEYLKRVMLHSAPLAAPADLAWFLASYARDAKARIEHAELPALANVRRALEEALGLTFEGKKGEHFFRSSLVQTLFYGVFSAWVLWCKQHPPASKARFDWHSAGWSLRVPMIRALYEQVATRGTLEPLGLVEVLDWAAAALNRVDRASFFAKFEEGHAVQYFYEPFLEAFDPELRKQLGIWYTPPEIVQYMVARVDTVLREELDRPDGLASPDVYVLDPCCGTGAYLVEVLKRIAATLRAKGEDALAAHDVKRAAMERVFGFEILPAPFVVSHLQLGLLLQNLGAPLAEKKDERVGVYLTNALTGWKPPKGPKQKLMFPEMEEERDKADEVKQHAPILVILGNPPYNGFAGVAVKEERELTEAYRTTKRAPAPQGQGLNDLYVRFFRMAERRIVEGKPGQGVVCFISNYSWLDGLSFTGMRERYLEAFDRIWIDCLNGDKYKTGKLTPEGEPDPSVFSTEFNREGIQVGTAIATLVKCNDSTQNTGVQFRHFWGREKRAELVHAAELDKQVGYEAVLPAMEMGLSLMPATSECAYFQWPLLTELFAAAFPGVKTSRDDAVVDTDRERLEQRIRQYFDPNVSHDEMRRISAGSMEGSPGFNGETTRNYLVKRGFLSEKIIRYCYRPFDTRWLYWEPETKLLDRNRAVYFRQVFKGNVWLSAGQRNRKDDFYQPQFTVCLADHHIVESNVAMVPLFLQETSDLLAQTAGQPKPNLTESASRYLLTFQARPEQLFFSTLAVLHSPTYRRENASALRQHWPRVPLPASKEALLASAELGRQVAALLDTESPVKGITAGTIRPELRAIGTVARSGGGKLDPDAGDLDVAAGWGHAGKGGVTMPGKGRAIERDYSPEELSALSPLSPNGGEGPGVRGTALECLGKTTSDIYLNDRAYWKNVPARVWEYTIGGYQVMKKWLSYREKELLGRGLTMDEARYVTEMSRRIAAILLLEPALDANYQAVKAATYPWPGRATTG